MRHQPIRTVRQAPTAQPAAPRRSEPRQAPRVKPVRASRLAVVALLLSALVLAAGCTQTSPPGNPGEPSKTPATTPPEGTAPQPGTTASTPPGTTASTPSGTTPSAPPAADAVDLSITLTEAPDAAPRTFRLVADGAATLAESTLPDPAAALAAVQRYGEKMFFPVPDPNRMCTEQYGGPETAVVTGWFHGREVASAFKRTNGCEIASWRALAPLFGALGGGTGAV